MNVSIEILLKQLICAALALVVTVFTTQSVARSSVLARNADVASVWVAEQGAHAAAARRLS